jgi:hypothetical protein
MFAFLAKPALCSAMFFISAAHIGMPQSRIEDRRTNPGKDLKSVKRTVWNLDGGVFFATDGHLPNGSCFRLSGQMTAPDFFDGLRRVDSGDGTAYFLRDKEVTEFPEQLFVTLHVLDYPCSQDLKDTAVRPPLTRETMSSLRLVFYWKEGVAMRRVESSKRTAATVKRLLPYAIDAAAELAPRFEWNYNFTIDSEGVPLTNDLVFVIEGEDHKIAARTAARL